MQNHKFIWDLSRINKRAMCSAIKSCRKIAKIHKKQILTDKQTCNQTVDMMCSLCSSWNIVFFLRWEVDWALSGYKKTRTQKELEFNEGADTFPHGALKKPFEDDLFTNTHPNWCLTEEADGKWDGVTILGSRKETSFSSPVISLQVQNGHDPLWSQGALFSGVLLHILTQQ